MRGWITRPVKFNVVICGLISTGFGLPPLKILSYLLGGLLFGLVTGLATEVLLKRFEGRWLYKRRLFLLIGVESLLLLYLFIPIYLAYFSVHPFFRTFPTLPDDLKVEIVTLNTGDGIKLQGWYLPSENGAAIIALHGSGGNRASVLPHARILAQNGYGVLMLDMRAHGESEGNQAGSWNADIDFDAAINYLQTRPDVEPNRIGAIGLSDGAKSILYGGEPFTAVRAFVVDGVGVGTVNDLLNPLTPHPLLAPLLIPEYWVAEYFIARFSDVEKGQSLRETVQDIAPRPILFIAGGDSNWEFELADKYAQSAGETADVWLVPNTGHIGAVDTHPEEYEQRVVNFFDEALLSD